MKLKHVKGQILYVIMIFSLCWFANSQLTCSCIF